MTYVVSLKDAKEEIEQQQRTIKRRTKEARMDTLR